MTSPLISNPTKQNSLTFESLREEGIQHLQRMAGHIWTDHNLHDPGITILEQLCIALSDLGLRLQYPIADLLAQKEGQAIDRGIHSPAQILSTQAVTLTDMRKLVLDVPGVRNTHIEKIKENYQPALYYNDVDHNLGLEKPKRTHKEISPLAIKGLYRIYIVVENNAIDARVRRDVWQQLMANRNLCEDIESVLVMGKEKVNVSIEIELNQEVDLQRLQYRIQKRLQQYMTPAVPFYTLKERLAKGFRMDQIFNGPLLQHGFIDDDELQALENKQSLRSSDMIRLIMEEEGVGAVRKLRIQGESQQEEDWYLKLSSPKVVFSLDKEKSKFLFFKNGLPITTQSDKQLLTLGEKIRKTAALPLQDRDILPRTGRYRTLDRYYSIQRHFPDIYGIGEAGLPPTATAQHKAQAKQLKGFLAFFDQILANYFAQWGQVKNLFDVHQVPAATYFSQQLYGEEGIPNFEEIRTTGPLPSLDEEKDAERNNRLINHLLARFCEDFTDYALMEYAGAADQKQSQLKKQFLADYPNLSSRRAAAIDYSKEIVLNENEASVNMPVYQQRLYFKLGFPLENWGRLSTLEASDKGGFYMVEHLLLRPNEGDKFQQSPMMVLPTNASFKRPPMKDPYSLQLSIVLPNWLESLQQTSIKSLLMKIILEESPAHVSIHFHWLDQQQMITFETSHFKWLGQLQKRFEHETNK